MFSKSSTSSERLANSKYPIYSIESKSSPLTSHIFVFLHRIARNSLKRKLLWIKTRSWAQLGFNLFLLSEWMNEQVFQLRSAHEDELGCPSNLKAKVCRRGVWAPKLAHHFLGSIVNITEIHIKSSKRPALMENIAYSSITLRWSSVFWNNLRKHFILSPEMSWSLCGPSLVESSLSHSSQKIYNTKIYFIWGNKTKRKKKTYSLKSYTLDLKSELDNAKECCFWSNDPLKSYKQSCRND